MKFIKKYATKYFAVIIIFCALIAFGTYFHKQTVYTKSEYDLQEIESGIYVKYYKTVSSIPAQNYEAAVIYVNGNILTLDGEVEISYVNEKPYVVIMENNIVHGNKIFLYILKGTIKIENPVIVR
ncbi:MAG: hypothetical protein NC489_40685 [Ruminococcus flavefaciens]|nr:hypothetical protein [Ruminococcus flavefaciens]